MRGWDRLLAGIALVVCACGDDARDLDAEARDASQAGATGQAGGGEAGRANAGSSAGRDAAIGASGSGGAIGVAGGAAAGTSGAVDGGTAPVTDGGAGSGPDEEPLMGSFVALTYNVAGLPEGLSSSMPARFTPLIGPLLNGYELVFLQESWLTPEDNPFDLLGLRAYHEILVAASEHPHKTVPADQPFGNDPSRPSALLGDGLNIFSRYPLAATTRIAWATCVDTASDCLAFKGFSMTPAQLGGLPVHLYDLHMEAGGSAEDDAARALGIEQMVAFIEEHSADIAVIMAGDFNLHTEGEPAASQFADLVMRAGLTDACTELECEDPGSIDKVLVRSSAELELRVESWESEADVFVSDMGEPLSDHLPLAVKIAWAAK